MKIIRAIAVPAVSILSVLMVGCAGLGAAAAVGAVVYYKSSQHEVATVNLDAQADKVYAEALKMIEASTTAEIAKQDPKAGLIEVTQGKEKISLKITSLEPKLTKLIVTSTVPTDKPGSASAVLARVGELCDQLGIPHHVVK